MILSRSKRKSPGGHSKFYPVNVKGKTIFVDKVTYKLYKKCSKKEDPIDCMKNKIRRSPGLYKNPKRLNFRSPIRFRSPIVRSTCNYTGKKGLKYDNCVNKKYECEKIKDGMFKAIIHHDRRSAKIQKSLGKKYKCIMSRSASQVSREALRSLERNFNN